MRSLWKGSISFGLVNIPCSLYPATRHNDISFNQLHRQCGSRVRYRRWCPYCDREVSPDDIVRGYEFQKGSYVTVEAEELEGLPLPQGRVIEIMDFVRLDDIDPVFYDRTYYLEPLEGAQRAYGLLREVMRRTERVAVARVVIRTRESLAAVRVFEDAVLAMETMFFADEIRPVTALPAAVTTSAAEPRPQELEMARLLVDSLATDFNPQNYVNEYRRALLDILEAKVRGEEVVPSPAPRPEGVIDLAEALQRSLRQVEKRRRPSQPAPPPPARRAAGESPPRPHA